MIEVVTFGEAMIRLSPPGALRLEQAQSLDIWPAGAELNVAVGLARLGAEVSWVSRLPLNELGRKVDASARANGVDTSGVVWAEDGRMGLFFVEVGNLPRPSWTLYDRADSAFACLDPGEFDWRELLSGAAAFHTSGITPALSEACARTVRAALEAARETGSRTIYDLNFRRLLTTPDDARDCVERLAPLIDILIGSSAELAAVFGLDDNPREIARRLRDELDIDLVVASSRVDASDGTQIRQTISVGEDVHELASPAFRTVDPLGGGDAFCAGFIFGLMTSGVRRGLELGNAMAALKQSIVGDFAVVDREEVERLLRGSGVQTLR
jgi:2-dehydro-3-deoxygluconokinase